MAFPDRIERPIEVAHPLGQVWAAQTTAKGPGTWFGNEATIDLRPGGLGRSRWSHGLPEDDPRRAYVEFTLEPDGAGTRLTVVESGFAQLPEDAHSKAYDRNADGWARELAELVDYLDAA
jgi:uncharacterized protein YndB with AHSA1/START domain